MTATVYQPQIQVTLLKLVKRTDGVAGVYNASSRELDLTPFLGDAGSVRTAKAITEPAGGFSIVFADQIDPTGTDSVYALAEPMDMIEIRMSRTPQVYAGGKLPLVMRGFVTRVQRVETMRDDGQPQRVVVISGHDFGVLWQINHVYWEVGIITDKPMLTVYGLQAAIGLQVAPMEVGQFITALVEKVMNQKIADMSAFSGRQVQPFTMDTQSLVPPGQGMVIPSTVSMFQDAPLWGLVEMVADQPWNEAWIEDSEAGPIFHFRPAPFMDINGALIMPGAQDPGTIQLDIESVVRLDMMRAADRVANFFWVPPGYSALDTNGQLTYSTLSTGGLLDFQYDNNNPALYGMKKMEVASRLQSPGTNQPISQYNAQQRPQAIGGWQEWFQTRATQLKLMNRDNSVFEEGSLLVRGSEDIIPGHNLYLTRGDLASMAYIVRVEHVFVPLRTWTTSLLVERGTGFLERNKFTGPPSPYWAEGRRSPLG